MNRQQVSQSRRVVSSSIQFCGLNNNLVGVKSLLRVAWVIINLNTRPSRCTRGVTDLRKPSPHDSPTLERRTVSVCPVGLRPRVPQRAAARSGRPSWFPAERPSRRCYRTIVGVSSQRTFLSFPPLCLLCYCPVSRLLWSTKKKKKKLPVASGLTCAGRREDHSASSPFPTHSTCECVCFCSKLFLAPSNPVQSWSRSYKLFGEFALHELGASWLGKREVGRSEWVPHPTQIHTAQVLLRGGSAGS